MDIRYSCNQRDFKRYTTEEVRNEFLITDLYKADEMVAVYSHVDRMVTLGCMPVNEVVSIDKGIDIWANFGTHYFLERREIGIFNIGDGAGTITADGVAYHLGYKDCLYITQGTKEVTFASDDAAKPAKFYMGSAPAHCRYETKLITLADAAKRPLGTLETCNKRTINQFIHPSVLKTCQLSMGMTALEPGSNWNTMPSPRSSGGTYRFLRLMLTGRPHRWISPSLRSSNPAIMRSVVVLPQPLGPRKEKHSPSLMVRLKSLTAVTVPSVLVVNCLVT